MAAYVRRSVRSKRRMFRRIIQNTSAIATVGASDQSAATQKLSTVAFYGACVGAARAPHDDALSTGRRAAACRDCPAVDAADGDGRGESLET